MKEADSIGIRMVENTKILGSFGGWLEFALDIEMGRHLMMRVGSGHNSMADFPGTPRFDNNYVYHFLNRPNLHCILPKASQT